MGTLNFAGPFAAETNNNTEQYETDDTTLNDIDESNISASQKIVINDVETALDLLITNMNTATIEQVNVDALLAAYLYLLSNCDDDDQFEFIFSALGGDCDSANCMCIERFTRDRNNNDHSYPIHCKQLSIEPYESMKYDIFDKIHCYYRHSFDGGYRLSSKEKEMLTEQKYQNDDNTFRILQMQRIILNKRRLPHKRHNKFKQFIPQLCITSQNVKYYSFGVQFKYAEPFNDEKYCGFKTRIPMKAKYDNLKQEMVLNELARITILRYDHEYAKAHKHFESNYCKNNLKPLYMHWTLKLDHILSVMLYCTQLQRVFSETYRENVQDSHNNFYYFGFYLKVIIHIFGCLMRHKPHKKFYHGISQKLYFSAYHDCYIFGPLSTTSEMAVAIGFTDHYEGEGLIVEFCDTNATTSALYFECRWLSDFAYENESLFIQNAYAISVSNIIEPSTGREYAFLFDSLNVLQCILHSGKPNSAKKEIDTDSVYYKIAEDILTTRDWKKYGEFGMYMIETFFQNQSSIDMDYDEMRRWHYTIYDVLFQDKIEWINMKAVLGLFPNTTLVEIRNIYLCDVIMVEIVNFLQQYQMQCKIDWIQIKPREKSALSIKKAMAKYQMQYEIREFVLFGTDFKTLDICKRDSNGYYLYKSLQM